MSSLLSVRAGLLLALASFASGAEQPKPQAVFEQYCFGCHGAAKPAAGVSLTKLTAGTVGESFQAWQKVAAVLEQNRMPPKGVPQLTSDQRTRTLSWVRNELVTFANKNAGDPGRVTVRRLTSGEYSYAVRDLTGVDLDIGRDFANDSVGGEGFMNFGDVQFVQEANLERYLESAKSIADHAVIGAGPVEFFTHPGKTGFELSAIARIKDIYTANGFRTVSGEGGESFGLDKYRKAFFVAWEHKQHPATPIGTFAAREGVSPRLAQHLYSVVTKPALEYPASEVAEKFRKLPVSEDGARKGCEDLEHFVTTWPSWLFARGDKAVGGAGDESPLVFNDSTLKPELTHKFAFNLVAGKPGSKATAATPARIFLNVSAVDPRMSGKSIVIWRNPTILVRRGTAGVTAKGIDAKAARVPLKDFVAPEVAAKLGFGRTVDGNSVAPTDFVTDGSDSFPVIIPEGAFGLQLQVEAELGNNHAQVIRVTFSDRSDGPVKGIPVHALLGDASTPTARNFRSGVLQFVSLLPPNSNGEPTPADKDPPPLPFDSTFNTPEHDAFDTTVKYVRDDRFVYDKVLDDATRVRLDRAWTDLYSSFAYHDAYLDLLAKHFKLNLKSPKIADLTSSEVAGLPQEARQYVESLRSQYLSVQAKESAGHAGHVEDCLQFASRAWRRPLTDREKENLRSFYRQSLVSEQDHTKAIRATLTRILISPAFLYRVEQSVQQAAVKPLTDWEIASRISFFLWSSIPDAELRRAAAAGELSQPAKLQLQVKRMAEDPKARRFSAEFFGQWLGFYRFDQFKGVDTTRFPEFTDEVRAAMYDESVSFCEYIVRHDRPVRELLNADYTFLNATLAKYYGVNRPLTAETQKVDGAASFNRGGVLRLGTVLTTTSAPLRTSPVKRGDWVLRRILGTPTPPPPPDAGSIPADDKLFGGLSLHDKLEAHKRNATCAGCHTRIDPLGFPLEHFDSTGRWRDKYSDGKAVYDSGKSFDQVEINGANGLMSYLQSKDEQVRRTLAMKLIGYSLGRTILPSDLGLIDRMVAQGNEAPFSGLLTEIILSKQFRNRLGQADEPSKYPLKAGIR